MDPRGKGIYARDPRWYPMKDPAGYARMLGCEFVAFHGFATSSDQFARARSLGLDVFVWSGPDSWQPHKWEGTLRTLYGRVAASGLDGLIADPEHGWQGEPGKRRELGRALQTISELVPSVGLTSYPSWGIDEIAETTSTVWASPQLYGIRDPAPLAQLHARADRWRAAFSAVVPSLAAWARSPLEQAAYLDSYAGERAALLWQAPDGNLIQPQPGTHLFDVLREWQPRKTGVRDFLTVAARRALLPFGLPRRT